MGLTGCGGFISLHRETALKVKVSVISRSRYLPSVCCGFLNRALKQKQRSYVGLNRYISLVEMRQQLLRMKVRGKFDSQNSDLFSLAHIKKIKEVIWDF